MAAVATVAAKKLGLPDRQAFFLASADQTAE